jgi:hypothetical protein
MMTENQKVALIGLTAVGVGLVLWKHHKGAEAETALGESLARDIDEDVGDAIADVSVANPEKGFFQQIKDAFSTPEGKALVPATFLAFGLLDAVPIPTDIGFFYTEKWLQDNRDKLSPRKFWLLQYFNYYGWDVAWYLSLFLITYYGGEDVEDKLKIGAALISSGAIVTMLWNFSQQPVTPVPAAA